MGLSQRGKKRIASIRRGSDPGRRRAAGNDIWDATELPRCADPRMVLMARNQMQAQAAEHAAKLDGLDRQIAQKHAEDREIKGMASHGWSRAWQSRRRSRPGGGR